MEQLLSKFKKIEPRNEFKEHSRALILNAPQNHQPGMLLYIARMLNFKTGLGMAAVFIVVILTGLSLLNQRLARSELVSGLDSQELNKEVEEFNIQLSQVRYYENSAKRIEVALKKTSGESITPEEQKEGINQLLDELIL